MSRRFGSRVHRKRCMCGGGTAPLCPPVLYSFAPQKELRAGGETWRREGSWCDLEEEGGCLRWRLFGKWGGKGSVTL